MSELGLCDCGRPWEYRQHSMGDILNCNECNVAWDCHDAIVEITAEVEQAKKDAERLVMAMWRDFYAEDSPNFAPLDSTAGIISQIDNMYAGIRAKVERLEAAATHYLDTSDLTPSEREKRRENLREALEGKDDD